jgi:hypothetical protein
VSRGVLLGGGRLRNQKEFHRAQAKAVEADISFIANNKRRCMYFCLWKEENVADIPN